MYNPSMFDNQWPELEVTPNYWVRFAQVSKHIIFTRQRGISSVDAVSKAWKLRQDFVNKHLGPNKHFVEVRSYRNSPGLPSRETRRLQYELFKQDEDRCLGFIACEMSGMVRSILRVGILLNRSSYPIEVIPNLEKAMSRAHAIERMWLLNSPATISSAHKTNRWEFLREETRVCFEIPQRHLFLVTVEGNLNKSDLPELFALHEEALLSGHLDSHHHFRIANYSKVNKANFQVRLALARETNRIYKHIATPRFTVMVNSPATLKAMVLSIGKFLPQPIYFAESHDDALARIEQSLQGHHAKSPLNISRQHQQPNDSRIVLDAKDIQWLNNCIGSLIFDEHTHNFPSLESSHPLVSTVECLRLLSIDLEELKLNQSHSIQTLIAAEESLGDALRTKSEFLSNISHEIRTPLNGILGMLQLLNQEPLRPEGREYLEIALNCSRGLLTLFNNTLDWNRLEVGKMELHLQEMAILDFITEITALPRARCQQQGMEFSLSIAENLPKKIMADPIRLRQILHNLLDNACKFTARGSISLQVLLEEELEKFWLGFRILDTGIGISTEQQTRLFKPFTQLDASMSRRHGGSGLGLAITAQLVKLHGGSIGLSSTPEQGSCFWFRIPLQECKY